MADKRPQPVFASEPNVSTIRPPKVNPREELARHRSLFTSSLHHESNVDREVYSRYFPRSQTQRLAEFLGFSEQDMDSFNKLLMTYPKNEEKRELVNILQLFINGQLDSLKTAKCLDKFLEEHKPLAWQLWKLFSNWRFNRLVEFTNTFKKTCITEVLKQEGGYGAPESVWASMQDTRLKSAANLAQATQQLIRKRTEQQLKQDRSLFLKSGLREKPVSFRKSLSEDQEKKSFFRTE